MPFLALLILLEYFFKSLKHSLSLFLLIKANKEHNTFLDTSAYDWDFFALLFKSFDKILLEIALILLKESSISRNDEFVKTEFKDWHKIVEKTETERLEEEKFLILKNSSLMFILNIFPTQ